MLISHNVIKMITNITHVIKISSESHHRLSNRHKAVKSAVYFTAVWKWGLKCACVWCSSASQIHTYKHTISVHIWISITYKPYLQCLWDRTRARYLPVAVESLDAAVKRVFIQIHRHNITSTHTRIQSNCSSSAHTRVHTHTHSLARSLACLLACYTLHTNSTKE